MYEETESERASKGAQFFEFFFAKKKTKEIFLKFYRDNSLKTHTHIETNKDNREIRYNIEE